MNIGRGAIVPSVEIFLLEPNANVWVNEPHVVVMANEIEWLIPWYFFD